MIEAFIEPTFESWHDRARRFLGAGVRPEDVLWVVEGEQPLLHRAAADLPPLPGKPARVPKRFVELARVAACHRAADRWTVMYRMAWRLVHERRTLLDDALDADAIRLRYLVQQVRHDLHRMLAFVRFRQVGEGDASRLVAWYTPDHDVVRLAADHFAERYPDLRWSIITPQGSVHWADGALTSGAGMPASALPQDDTDEAAESLWRVYYAAVFNPARVNEAKLRRDMPVKFWTALPEARDIPSLVASAPETAERFRGRGGGTTQRAAVPSTLDLQELQRAAACCRNCDLYEHATRTVFGEGPASAPLMLVGEQPGDFEDRAGRPFVGPAGEVLDRALVLAGIDRREVYLTNAVKHFAWEPRGKRRIHRTPRLSEMQACRPWLERELASVKPRVLVLLGGVAARALLGPQARVTTMRGSVVSAAWAPAIIVTYHPSAVLRAADASAQAETFDLLVTDLRTAAGRLAQAAHP